MQLFGRTLREYVLFARVFLILTAVVGLLRLGLSLAGAPDGFTDWVSINAITLVAVVVFSIRVHTTGFGGYKHLLVLVVLEILAGEIIITGGIVLAALTGVANIFSVPEFAGGFDNHLVHAASHLLLGPTVAAVLVWIPGAAVLFVTKRLVKRPASD